MSLSALISSSYSRPNIRPPGQEEPRESVRASEMPLPPGHAPCRQRSLRVQIKECSTVLGLEAWRPKFLTLINF